MERQRQRKLLELLAKRQDWMTSRQLAALLKVSDRTIRSDIKAIKELYPEPLIESNIQKGYRVIRANLQNIYGLTGHPLSAGHTDGRDVTEKNSYRPGQAGNQDEMQIPQTAEARCVYIIQKLLFEVKELNVVQLEEQIYVSSYTIERDLKRIRELLKSYSGLKLVRSGKRISLQGDELSKRRFYRNLLIAEVQKNFLNLNQLAALYKEFNLLEVKNIFLSVLGEYNYTIHESLLLMLILHAGTSIQRMLHFNYISHRDDNGSMKDTIEYQISEEFYRRISARLHFKVRESEINRFALVIMGRRSSHYASDYVSYRGNWINTKQLAVEAVGQIYDMFGIDLRSDEDLISGLKLHLHGLIDREEKGIMLEDVFAEEIRRKYPLIFEMGIYMTEFLGRQLGTKISDAESSLLAIHLGGASERQNAKSRYRAVVILPYNQAFARICVAKLSEMFGERMQIVAALHYFEEETVRKLEPDLILTAFNITHTLDVLTVQINLFMDFETESNVLKVLNQLDSQAFHVEFVTNIGKLLRRAHYYENLDCKTPEEVIRTLCSGLESEAAVDASFCDVVLKREQMAPTSFINTFAIPHALGSFARVSTIAVAQLKNPVQWGHFSVKLVMLFAVNENDQRMIKMFFDWVSSLLNHMDRLARLCVPCSYDRFIDQIME